MLTHECPVCRDVFYFFFSSPNHSNIADDKVKIGTSNEVEVSIRPRTLSGVILMVWGAGDYLGIELINGQVVVNVNNGAGDIEAALDVANICDGQWRTIRGEGL